MTWQTVRLFLILSILLGWQSRQLDFVMAYPQAPAEMPLYMKLPQGYKRNGITRKTYALKLLRNVYGQKQAGRVWNKFMDQGMREIGFTPSQFDPVSTTEGPSLFWSTLTIALSLPLLTKPLTKWSKIYVLAPDDSW